MWTLTLNCLKLLFDVEITRCDYQGLIEVVSLEKGACIICNEEGKLLGYILLADQVKTDAKAAVERLEKLGVSTSMLTGDSRENDAALYRNLQSLASNAYGLYRCDLHTENQSALRLDQVRQLFHTIEVSWNSEEY